MAEVAPRKRQKTEDAQTDGQVYPLPPEVFAIIFSFLPDADLRYVLFATTVFRDLAYHELYYNPSRPRALRSIITAVSLEYSRTRGYVHTKHMSDHVCCYAVHFGGNNKRTSRWNIDIAATSPGRLMQMKQELALQAGILRAMVHILKHRHKLRATAACVGSVEVLDVCDLLGAGVLTLQQEREPRGSLECIAEIYGHLDVLQWLYATPRSTYHDRTVTTGYLAAEHGQLAVIQWFVEMRLVNVDRYGSGKELALIAARHERMHIFNWLRDLGTVSNIDRTCERLIADDCSSSVMDRLHRGLPQQWPCYGHHCVYAMRALVRTK